MSPAHGSSNSSRFAVAAAWSLAGAGLLLALLLALARPERGAWGDEGTYQAMTASLVHDGDLVFDQSDRDRARAESPPTTVILQVVGTDVSYSKPVLYPLLGAPFFAIAGGRGLVALNLLLTAAAVWLAWRYLRRLGARGAAALTLVTFFGCSALPFYLGWRMSDAALCAFALAGLVLAAGALRADEGRPLIAAALGGLLLGLAASMRLPGGALAAAAVAGALWTGHRRRGLAIALTALLGFGAASAAGVFLTGTANPYKTVRSSFSATTGYPVADEPAAEARFESHPATQSATWLPRFDATRSGYSALYSLVGRHTGLAFYFPAALALLWVILRRPDRLGLALLLGPLAAGLFYLLWMPENYFGGSTFIGNRYFLMAYPALLAALPRLPPARWLAAAWIVGLVAGGSALVSLRAAGASDPSSQSHAAAGLFRLLPNESTAQKIDGFRGRFWARDFVRFTDRFARVGKHAFELEAGVPAAELEVAFRLPRDELRLRLTPTVPGTRLRFRDWRRSESFELGSGQQTITLPLSPAWRRHTYWWRAPDVYQVRTLRLAVEHPDDEAAVVDVRYLGAGGRSRREPGRRGAG